LMSLCVSFLQVVNLKIIPLNQLPRVSEEEKIDKVRATIVSTNLPVLVYKNNKLIGIIDEYSVLRNFFKPGVAKDFIVTPPTLSLDKDIEEQLFAIKDAQVRAYLVEQKKKLIGIVLKEQFMYSIKSYFANRKVKEILKDLIVVNKNESLASIISKLNEKGLRTIAVTENGRIQGYISPYRLLTQIHEKLKIIPQASKQASGLIASDLAVETLPMIDENGSIEKAIDALLYVHFGVITSNGKPVGSISLLSVLSSLRKPSRVNFLIEGLPVEEADIAHEHLINVCEKISKIHGINNVHLAAKKQGHGVYVMKLTVGKDHFLVEKKSFNNALHELACALKNKYFSKIKKSSVHSHIENAEKKVKKKF
ncbi:MAG: CBS domain-containing protein, partial [Candidatus Micrarchaeota archaeon]|nr:CBS domain-containing protein [Candidatus Micrarchaeota archaeon]